jgi:hypothetical protein
MSHQFEIVFTPGSPDMNENNPDMDTLHIGSLPEENSTVNYYSGSAIVRVSESPADAEMQIDQETELESDSYITASMPTAEEARNKNGFVEWVKGHKVAASMGAITIASTVATATTGNLGEVLDNAIHNVPWAVGGVAASEGTFIAGGAAMLVSAGARARQVLKPRNLLNIRQQVTDLNDEIKSDPTPRQGLLDRKLFKAGFAANALGAVGTAGFGIAAVVETAPPQGWGAAAFAGLDIVATVGLRLAILDALKPTPETAGE